MPNDRFLAGANESLERNLNKNESTIFASYRLIGAIFFFGGAGFLLDRSLETSPWLLLLGLLTGVSAGFLGIARLIRRS